MMPKSATELMQEILFSAVTDSLEALKSASKGMPNTLLRDINAIHANSTFADLPKELQAAILANVRTAFNRLLKEGYSVAPSQPAAPRSTPSQPPPAFGKGPRPGGGARKPGRPTRPRGPAKPR